jgi:hypothetical protein
MALGSQSLLQSGQLIELFPDWPDELFPLHAIFPSRHHRAAKVRVFTDFCLQLIRAQNGEMARITRWEHEHVLEAVQKRLDKNTHAMRQRRETAEHPFGTLKMRMGATHFLMKRLPKVATEMALHVLAYNLTRVMNIMGIQPLMAAIQA